MEQAGVIVGHWRLSWKLVLACDSEVTSWTMFGSCEDTETGAAAWSELGEHMLLNIVLSQLN